jgi:hypothetical protein
MLSKIYTRPRHNSGGFHLFIFLLLFLVGVRLSPLGTVATTGLFYQPQMVDDGDCGAIGGMKFATGN